MSDNGANGDRLYEQLLNNRFAEQSKVQNVTADKVLSDQRAALRATFERACSFEQGAVGENRGAAQANRGAYSLAGRKANNEDTKTTALDAQEKVFERSVEDNQAQGMPNVRLGPVALVLAPMNVAGNGATVKGNATSVIRKGTSTTLIATYYGIPARSAGNNAASMGGSNGVADGRYKMAAKGGLDHAYKMAAKDKDDCKISVYDPEEVGAQDRTNNTTTPTEKRAAYTALLTQEGPGGEGSYAFKTATQTIQWSPEGTIVFSTPRVSGNNGRFPSLKCLRRVGTAREIVSSLVWLLLLAISIYIFVQVVFPFCGFKL